MADFVISIFNTGLFLLLFILNIILLFILNILLL
jgi:hypothetical protein